MPTMSSWMARVEQKRREQNREQNLSVDKLAQRLGISRATYYLYKSDPTKHPVSRDIVAAFADFLGEDVEALTFEMQPAAAPTHRAFLEAAAARQLSIHLYQQHVAGLAQALGMLTEDATERPFTGSNTVLAQPRRPHGVDVVVRLLRDQLPDEPNPVEALVGVLPRQRGDERPEREYQYQIYVVPEELAETVGNAPSVRARRVLDRTRRKVDDILSRAMLPVTREHSSELFLGLLRGRADVLLYPGLLDMRAPETGLEPPEGRSILVTGVYYAGAPDVAALLARQLRFGFSTFDEMARQQIRAGLRGLPSELQRRASERIASAVLTDHSASAGPMVWATDDPDTLLSLAGDELKTFSGQCVLLELSDDALDYAAHGVSRVDEENNPGEESVSTWRKTLLRQQDQLRAVLPETTLTQLIELPSNAAKTADGYPDAVHAMFDEYVKAHEAVAGRINRE